MKQEAGRRKEEAGKAPIRGAQSFVGVMAAVWKRPGLVGVEIAWRWAFWVAFVYLGGVVLGALGMEVQFHPEVLTSVSAFQPVQTVTSLDAFFRGLDPLSGTLMLRVVIVIVLLWTVAWSLGRAVLLKRLGVELKAERVTIWVLALMRAGTAFVALGLWVGVCRWALEAMVLRPAVANREPALVPAFAVMVTATLVMFVAWCTVSWCLQLAPVLAMAKGLGVAGSLRAAWGSGELRGKLIEINLVMGIVKVALVVLAMVFSACPLPFSSVETQTFLTCWWCGVGVLWVVASDYFHVVRAAAYVELWRAYDFSAETAAPGAEAAS